MFLSLNVRPHGRSDVQCAPWDVQGAQEGMSQQSLLLLRARMASGSILYTYRVTRIPLRHLPRPPGGLGGPLQGIHVSPDCGRLRPPADPGSLR